MRLVLQYSESVLGRFKRIMHMYFAQSCGSANKCTVFPYLHVHVRKLTLSSGFILATALVDSKVMLKVVTIGSKVINSAKTKCSCLERKVTNLHSCFEPHARVTSNVPSAWQVAVSLLTGARPLLHLSVHTVPTGSWYDVAPAQDTLPCVTLGNAHVCATVVWINAKNKQSETMTKYRCLRFGAHPRSRNVWMSWCYYENSWCCYWELCTYGRKYNRDDEHKNAIAFSHVMQNVSHTTVECGLAWFYERMTNFGNLFWFIIRCFSQVSGRIVTKESDAHWSRHNCLRRTWNADVIT